MLSLPSNAHAACDYCRCSCSKSDSCLKKGKKKPLKCWLNSQDVPRTCSVCTFSPFFNTKHLQTARPLTHVPAKVAEEQMARRPYRAPQINLYLPPPPKKNPQHCIRRGLQEAGHKAGHPAAVPAGCCGPAPSNWDQWGPEQIPCALSETHFSHFKQCLLWTLNHSQGNPDFQAYRFFFSSASRASSSMCFTYCQTECINV